MSAFWLNKPWVQTPPDPVRQVNKYVLARPLTRYDLDEVVAIENTIFPFPWSKTNFVDSLKAEYDAWLFNDSSNSAKPIVGYALLMWVLDEVHLLNLSVAATRQGQGLGRQLLYWLAQDIYERGATSALLEVRPSNHIAQALYAGCGFSQIGLRRNYYPSFGGSFEDALVMRAALPLKPL